MKPSISERVPELGCELTRGEGKDAEGQKGWGLGGRQDEADGTLQGHQGTEMSRAGLG